MSRNDAVPVSILRHRPFVLYWGARICASLGFQMVGVAVGWQMYALTGNAFDLGLVGLVQFLPITVLMLVAGQLADRYDRRAHPADLPGDRGARRGGARGRALGGWISKDFILTTVFFFGAARAFEAPTKQTLLPAVVPAPLFPRAVAASSSAKQAATIGGPAVGGLLYAVGPAVRLHAPASVRRRSAGLLAFVPVVRRAAGPRRRSPSKCSSPASPSSAATRSCSA